MERKFDVNSKVRDWYSETYPKDVLRKAIDGAATFRDVVECLNRNKNPMFMLGLHDSFVRDRILGKIAVLSGVSFDVVYNKWALGNQAPDIPWKADPSRGQEPHLGARGLGPGPREGIGEFKNSPILKNAAELQGERDVVECNIVGGYGMNIEILSFEECDDKDYGETVVQFRHGNEVSFCFTELTVQNILANPNQLLMELREYETGAEDRVRPLWSDLSEGLLEAVLYNPFDMHFVEYENFDADVNTLKLEAAFFDEVNKLGIYGAITCGEDDALLTVYAGAMGAINWKGHEGYGTPCFSVELGEKERSLLNQDSLDEKIYKARSLERPLGEVIDAAKQAALQERCEQVVFKDFDGEYGFCQSVDGVPLVQLLEGERILGKVVFSQNQKDVEFVPPKIDPVR